VTGEGSEKVGYRRTSLKNQQSNDPRRVIIDCMHMNPYLLTMVGLTLLDSLLLVLSTSSGGSCRSSSSSSGSSSINARTQRIDSFCGNGQYLALSHDTSALFHPWDIGLNAFDMIVTSTVRCCCFCCCCCCCGGT
jgi:hypothetical protein